MKQILKSTSIVYFAAILSIGLASCCKDKPEIISDPPLGKNIHTTSTGMHVSKSIVRNGETISLTTDVSGTIDGKDITFTVTYYFDGIEIGTSTDSENKYKIDYIVKNLSLGSHSLESHATYGKVTNKFTLLITVIE